MLPAVVSSAVALIAITNYTELRLLAESGLAAKDLLPHFISFGLPTSIAVILVLSALYHAHRETVLQLKIRSKELLLKSQRDTLTGLASREHFEHGLIEAVDRFREVGEDFSVLLLDLDHFKRVNDLHGHQTGDALLKQVSMRLSRLVGPHATVARLGGDEFVILQTRVGSAAEVGSLCALICSELEQPFEIEKRQLISSVSVGAVTASQKSYEPSDYLRAADMALYDAKAKGRSCYRFYSDELDQRLRRRDRLDTDLRVAINSTCGIDVFYQPQIDGRGELTGVEALFRWKHAHLGWIPALEAVEIAEESNLILHLGDFVLTKVAKFARKHPSLSVAVNLSPAQFTRSDNFAEQMRRFACEEGLRPAQLEFEITERMFVEIGGESESQIELLRNHGFRVALDDFGTGYSSLSYLRRFQIDRLKLDKSFAEESEAYENIAIMRASVSLAHMLGLEVVAEGIETQEQEAIALESGCDAVQGNYYGAPMCAQDFEEFLRARSQKAA